MRKLLLLSLAGLPISATAQTGELPGWQRIQLEDGAVRYDAPGQQGIILVGEQRQADPATAVRALAADMGANSTCPGMGGVVPSQRGAMTEASAAANGVRCRIVGVPSGSGTTLFFLLTVAGFADGDRALDRLVASASPSGAAPAPLRSAAAPPAPDNRNVDAALKQAAAAVPASHRPVSAVTHGTGSFSGWPPSYVYRVSPRFLFGNGFAPTCSDFDPRSLLPSPGAPLGEDCEILPWRRGANGVQFKMEDGTWGAGDTGEGVEPFKPGERIDVAFGNVSGIGFNFTGGINTNTLSGDTLRMTRDGEIAVGSWTTTVISGANIGGGVARNEGPLVGRYYLDGYIIVIAAPDGTISRGLIGYVPDSQQGKRVGHIYLNGVHYWEPD
jgi:hypothetical protein